MTIFLLFEASCVQRPAVTAVPAASAQDVSNAQNKILRNLTDEILLALATHNYAGLESCLEPAGTALTGRQIALRLLGSHADSMVIEHWNAQQINVAIDPDSSWATTRTEITMRRTPNRKQTTTILTLRFHRSSHWRLILSSEKAAVE